MPFHLALLVETPCIEYRLRSPLFSPLYSGWARLSRPFCVAPALEVCTFVPFLPTSRQADPLPVCWRDFPALICSVYFPDRRIYTCSLAYDAFSFLVSDLPRPLNSVKQ